jgi:hypothetical protein
MCPPLPPTRHLPHTGWYTHTSLQDFWKRDAQFHRHPIHADPHLYNKTVPIGVHGDDVADVRDDKVTVVTFGSVCGLRMNAWDSRFVFTILPYRLQVGRETLWAIFEIFMWSLQCAMSGTFPLHDHAGNPFPPGSWRRRVAGSPIAGTMAA